MKYKHEKSIIDAHDTFRAYLQRNHIHTFKEQTQGEKRIIPATFINVGGLIATKVSLYRPNTKDGDPRIWVYELKKLAKAYNLIGFIYLNDTFYIINCSDRPAVEYALSGNGPLSTLIKTIAGDLNYGAKGLLNKLKKISAKGFIPTITEGDTGVGMTLEAELGIAANSLAEPDYHGIELKASRKKPRGTKNRVTLFSKAPNWKLSPIGKVMDLLKKHGYDDENGRLSLYHTINGKKPNSLGLQLTIDYEKDTLKQVHIDGDKITHDTTWQLSDIRKSLESKHPETFWVKADAEVIDGKEHFHYTHVTYTKSPKITHLEMLIEDGVITLDYTMHQQSSTRVRDHGYLFKILPANFNALFPKPNPFILNEPT
ncbi:MvaI/BcnI family restriction endonuclease [bacterium]|nr:MvaI/BcnI family restriction endonuclease [bacterium]